MSENNREISRLNAMLENPNVTIGCPAVVFDHFEVKDKNRFCFEIIYTWCTFFADKRQKQTKHRTFFGFSDDILVEPLGKARQNVSTSINELEQGGLIEIILPKTKHRKIILSDELLEYLEDKRREWSGLKSRKESDETRQLRKELEQLKKENAKYERALRKQFEPSVYTRLLMERNYFTKQQLKTPLFLEEFNVLLMDYARRIGHLQLMIQLNYIMTHKKGRIHNKHQYLISALEDGIAKLQGGQLSDEDWEAQLLQDAERFQQQNSN